MLGPVASTLAVGDEASRTSDGAKCVAQSALGEIKQWGSGDASMTKFRGGPNRFPTGRFVRRRGRRIVIPFIHGGITADPVRSGRCWPKASPATSWGSGTVWLSMASMTGCAICNSPGGTNRRHLPRHDHRGGARGGRATAGGSQHRHRRRGGWHLWHDAAPRPHPRQFLKIKARAPRPSCEPIFAACRRCAEPGMWNGPTPTPGAFPPMSPSGSGDGGLGFSLVPREPALERHIGRHITGVMGGDGGIEWELRAKVRAGVVMWF